VGGGGGGVKGEKKLIEWGKKPFFLSELPWGGKAMQKNSAFLTTEWKWTAEERAGRFPSRRGEDIFKKTRHSTEKKQFALNEKKEVQSVEEKKKVVKLKERRGRGRTVLFQWQKKSISGKGEPAITPFA